MNIEHFFQIQIHILHSKIGFNSYFLVFLGFLVLSIIKKFMAVLQRTKLNIYSGAFSGKIAYGF